MTEDQANSMMQRGRASRGRGALFRGQAWKLKTLVQLGRDRGMTSGRTITFEEEEESGEKESSNTSHMSSLALEQALRAEQMRLAQAERALKRRSSQLRESAFTEVTELGEEGRSHACPKLNEPHTFRGSYTEVYNVLNQLHQVLRYLMQCHCYPDDYTGYASTYIHWMLVC